MTDHHDTIKRILGPSRPEILCDECFEQIDAYVELELAGADADLELPGMAPHLEGCPACAEEYLALKALASGSP